MAAQGVHDGQAVPGGSAGAVDVDVELVDVEIGDLAGEVGGGDSVAPQVGADGAVEGDVSGRRG